MLKDKTKAGEEGEMMKVKDKRIIVEEIRENYTKLVTKNFPGLFTFKL